MLELLLRNKCTRYESKSKSCLLMFLLRNIFQPFSITFLVVNLSVTMNPVICYDIQYMQQQFG